MSYERCSLAADKCPVIVHDVGAPVGSIVLKRGIGTAKARARMVGRMYTIGVIHRDPSISLSWLKGAPVDATKTKEDVERIVEELEAAERT